MNAYDRFCGWLEQRDEKPNRWQAAIAQGLLSAPRTSGKTWLIKRLLAFDTCANERYENILLSGDVNLVDDIQDEQGRRRYTLGAVDGCPSMIPDVEGFWTPAND